MKTKKILSMILALCMIISFFAVGVVSTNAAESEDEPVMGVEDSTEPEFEDPTSESTETPTQEPTEVLSGDGKWKFKNVYNFEMYDGDPFIVSAEKAAKDSKYYDYTFVHIIAKKEVSGIKRFDYVLLGYKYNKDPRFISAFGYNYNWDIVTVKYAKTSDSYLTAKSETIDIADVKTTDKTSDVWSITAKSTDKDDMIGGEELPDAVCAALTNYSDVKLDMIAQLGAQELDGTNRRFLCYGTKDSKTELYVVDTHEKDDIAEVTKVSLFDLSAYAPDSTLTDYANELADKTEELKKSNESNQSSQNTTITTTGSSTNGGSSASATSPKTGQEDTIVFVMLGVMILASAVIFFVRKRERT